MQKKSILHYYIITLGCQMNKNDSERVAGLLSTGGWKVVERPELADLIIINTCSVRQAAEDRVCGLVYNWQELRKGNPELLIAVTGCMPGRDKDGKTKKRLKGADLFFPIDELLMLPQWIRGLRPDWDIVGAVSSDYLDILPERKEKHRAFVTIQTGCNNFCTYCVVPHARGRERNRKVIDILDEVNKAVADGCKEVVLLGQVVNHYIAPDPDNFSTHNPFCHSRENGNPVATHTINTWIPVFTGMAGNKDDFAALLWEINQITGEFRIHWTAADPQYFSDYQIEALNQPKQVNYLHLPVQSGDDEILKKMNRHYTREKYLDLIKKIRIARPEIAIGTDLVLGFCGETEEHFQNTVNLFKQCDFDIAYQAMYSERSGTAAANALKDDVAKIEKKRRWQVIQDLMEETTHRKNQKYLHQSMGVLVDKCEDGICSGYSNEMKSVQFLGTADLVGKPVKIKITQAETWVLKGVVSVSDNDA